MMETGLFVRKAQQSDIPAILEIEWECFREDSFSKEQFAYLISRSKGTFYVMMEGDRVIAYVSLLFHGGTHYLRIYSIAVHPDFRGKGLGQATANIFTHISQIKGTFRQPSAQLHI